VAVNEVDGGVDVCVREVCGVRLSDLVREVPDQGLGLGVGVRCTGGPEAGDLVVVRELRSGTWVHLCNLHSLKASRENQELL